MSFLNIGDGQVQQSDLVPTDAHVKTDAVDMTTAKTNALPQQQSSSSQIPSDDTGEARSFDTSQADIKSEGQEQAQALSNASMHAQAQAATPIGTCSATPNARASRLFRERRKERERILRETVTELAERNAALEALLLQHGIAPPVAATLRNDLSIHRSQHLGGLPIYIPGLISARPPPIACVAEPGNGHHHGNPPTNAHRILDFYQHSSSPMLLEDSFWTCERSHDPAVPPSSERSPLSATLFDPELSPLRAFSSSSPPSLAFGESLQVHNEAAVVSPLRTTQFGHLQPASRVGGESRPGNSSGGSGPHLPFAPNPTALQAGPSVQQTGPPSSSGAMSSAVGTYFGRIHRGSVIPPFIGMRDAARSHSRTHSDSALLARMPNLTPAEQRAIAARSGPFPPHFGQPGAIHEAVAIHHPLPSWQHQQQDLGMPQPSFTRSGASPLRQTDQVWSSGPNAPIRSGASAEALEAHPCVDQPVLPSPPRNLVATSSDPSRSMFAGQATASTSVAGFAGSNWPRATAHGEQHGFDRQESVPSAASLPIPASSSGSTQVRSDSNCETPSQQSVAGRPYVAHSVFEMCYNDESMQDGDTHTHDCCLVSGILCVRCSSKIAAGSSMAASRSFDAPNTFAVETERPENPSRSTI